MNAYGNSFGKSSLIVLTLLAGCVAVSCQTVSSTSMTASSASVFRTEIPALGLLPFSADDPENGSATSDSSPPQRHGIILRTLGRSIQDQGQLYSAPFKARNLKWDALFLGTAAVLFATDNKIDRNLPLGHINLSRDISNVSLGGTSAALVGLWAYGIKTHNEHAKETGELELQTLTDTFLIYTPMQFLAGRQRPTEGTRSGEFGYHRSINTSFPAGHPMFTWAMATLVAHEYPKPWVQALAYGAATSVSLGRLFGHEHWASDVMVGSALGYLISSHVFHSRCDPERSYACHRRSRN